MMVKSNEDKLPPNSYQQIKKWSRSKDKTGNQQELLSAKNVGKRGSRQTH